MEGVPWQGCHTPELGDHGLVSRAETQTKSLLQTAHAVGLSIGLDCNYVDEDITRVLSQVHYMQLIAMRWANQHERNKGQGVTHTASVQR